MPVLELPASPGYGSKRQFTDPVFFMQGSEDKIHKIFPVVAPQGDHLQDLLTHGYESAGVISKRGIE